MSSLKISRAFTVTTVLALAVAIGVIVKDRLEPPAVTVTQAQSDPDQQLQLRKLEAQLSTLSATTRRDGVGSRAELEARLAAMKVELRTLQLQLDKGAGTGHEAKTARTEPLPDLAEQALAEQERIQQRVTSLENAMLSEPLDVSWSSLAAGDLSRSTIDPQLANTRLGEVRCAATLCRIEVSHATREAEQTFMVQMNQLDSFRDSEGFIQHQERPDGSLATVMYVSRSGHALPGQEQS